MLKNAFFDSGADGESMQFLYNNGTVVGPTGQTYDNINAPSSWFFYWLENAPGVDPASLTGRPEAGPIQRDQFPDSLRFIAGSDHSFKSFTFWRNHIMGIGQTVAAQPGNLYTWGINAHAWYSECSTRPHSPPYEKDCAAPLTWAHDRFYLAIDPNGGKNPFDADLVWLEHEAPYGTFPELPLVSPTVIATAPYITVWFMSRTSHSLKHCDVYLAEADLVEESPQNDDCTWARTDYKRVYNVYPSNITRDEYLALAARIYDEYGLETLGPSYDDSVIGDGLGSKTARLWNIPHAKQTDFLRFFDEHYPKKDYKIEFAGTPDQPPPPPPPPGEMISLHIQTETSGLIDYIGQMAQRGNPLRWVKLVLGFETSRAIVEASPSTQILARNMTNPQLWQDHKKQAAALVDAIWPAVLANPIHAIELTNELMGTSNTSDEILDYVALEVAISNEIKRRSDILFDQTGRTVIGALGSVPVGNLQHGAQTALMQPMVDAAARNGHGVAYHPYYPATLDAALTLKWLLEEGYHHHLRLQLSWAESLDGVLDIPIFYNEGGAIETTVREDKRPGAYNASAGWRKAHGGDFGLYMDFLLRLRQLILESPGGNNVQTYSLFTTGDPRIIGWHDFIVGPAEYPVMLAALV